MVHLDLRVPSSVPLEVYGVTPAAVAKRTELEVAKIAVRHGNRAEPLGEFFDVSTRMTTADSADLRFAGDTRNVHGIGAGMNGGFVYVENDAGRHAGAKMSGGSLVIDSSAGDWLGAEMSGGEIEVRLSAGNQVGAAYRGSRRGMRGGSIDIRGDAGDELGLRMHRGHITIGGRAGSFAGAAMISGTIVLNGGAGGRLGAGMKRGTILLRDEPKLPPGFAFACEYRPTFTPLYLGERSLVRCYRGDLAAGGRGEVLHVVSGAG